MSSVFTFQRRIEFCETDAAGIAHFSSLIIYMEQAEHALLRSVGLSVAASHLSASQSSVAKTGQAVAYSWPRVKVDCDFCLPGRFEDVISIETTVGVLGKKSITYQHHLSIGSTTIATGKMTSVCCVREAGSLVSTPIPPSIRDLLLPFCGSADLAKHV